MLALFGPRYQNREMRMHAYTPAEQPTGESVFSIRNLDPLAHAGTTADPNKYIAFDYLQLIPAKPLSGTILLIR